MLDADHKAIADFKKECRNYYYYIADYNEILLKMKRLQVKMEGVHSIDFQRVKSTVKGPKSSKIVTYVDAKIELERQLKEVEDKISYIIRVIRSLDTPPMHAIVWMIYIQRRRIGDVAEEYETSRDYLAQKISELFARRFPGNGTAVIEDEPEDDVVFEQVPSDDEEESEYGA